uniref:Uncharacterized protein n=1 Tax=Dicentrarchus labrax TaxID=13489 RepID=A0A8C4NZ06_DICLA
MESRFTQGKSAVVQYCQSRVYSAGRAGTEREEGGKSTEHTAINQIIFFVSVWRALSGEETDKLEQASDDDKTYYIIEKEPLHIELCSLHRRDHRGFPAMVTVHWHKGTTLMRQRQNEVLVFRSIRLTPAISEPNS